MKERGFTYFAAKFEKYAKRWKEDGNNDIDAGSCAHFLFLVVVIVTVRENVMRRIKTMEVLIYRTWSTPEFPFLNRFLGPRRFFFVFGQRLKD